MSNALKRKKKKMEPLGYSKSELLNMQKYARQKRIQTGLSVKRTGTCG